MSKKDSVVISTPIYCLNEACLVLFHIRLLENMVCPVQNLVKVFFYVLTFGFGLHLLYKAPKYHLIVFTSIFTPTEIVA